MPLSLSFTPFLTIVLKYKYIRTSLSLHISYTHTNYRGHTACAAAYLTPNITTYLSSFRKGFDEGLKDIKLDFMKSDGGYVLSFFLPTWFETNTFLSFLQKFHMILQHTTLFSSFCDML